jgi:sulfate permease, SulP family
LRKASYPKVAELGRIGNTEFYSDIERHSDNQQIPGLLILRIESSILYFNAENILEEINKKLAERKDTKAIILDLASAPYVDVAGSKMLLELVKSLKNRNIQLNLVDTLSEVRELLRKQGLEELTGHISRRNSVHNAVTEYTQATSGVI